MYIISNVRLRAYALKRVMRWEQGRKVESRAESREQRAWGRYKREVCCSACVVLICRSSIFRADITIITALLSALCSLLLTESADQRKRNRTARREQTRT